MARTVLKETVAKNSDIINAAKVKFQKNCWRCIGAMLLILLGYVLPASYRKSLPELIEGGYAVWTLPVTIVFAYWSYTMQLTPAAFFIAMAKPADDPVSGPRLGEAVKRGVIRAGETCIAAHLTGIIIFLKTLLLIVPGILALLDYAMIFNLLADEDGIGPVEAMRKSRAMMYGHRWQYVKLQARIVLLMLSPVVFILVAVFYCKSVIFPLLLTVGAIIVFILLLPFVFLIQCSFYHELKTEESNPSPAGCPVWVRITGIALIVFTSVISIIVTIAGCGASL